MVFSSPVFLLLFLPFVLLVYFNPFFRGRKFRNYFLLLASLGFYAWGEPAFVFVMLLSILINWAFTLRMDPETSPARRRAILAIPIIYDVALIFVFKYLSFALRAAGALVGGLPRVDIVLPIGISFFTFQIMSYVFDVYYRTEKAQRNVLNVALYISLFPQLIAGPIVRYGTVAGEIMNRRETPAEFTRGVERFAYGLGKKVLLANYMAVIADNVFSLRGGMSMATAWLGVLAYTLQIYFDFSGYSDMAIGMGLMFGFHFEENFNYPYAAWSITDFWRRWHISLSTWFRDYVYIPLGGNRTGKGRFAFNLFVVWLLTGIWHGANWTFIAWGLYYFVFLIAEKTLGFARRPSALSRAYTLLAVMVGWVIFRSPSLTAAWEYLGYMVGTHGVADDVFRHYLRGSGLMLPVAALLSLPVIPWLRRRLGLPGADGLNRVAGRGEDLARALSLAVVFALALIVSINSTYNPFIYFNF